MIVYRVHIADDRDGSQGYAWFEDRESASKRVAAFEQALTEDVHSECTIERVDMDFVKNKYPVGLLISFLDHYAGHADNG